MNGMTFCQGCFATMGEDIPASIRRFGKEKIFFVHFRDVQGTRERFQETFHDDGKTDMYEAMKPITTLGLPVLPSDHVPTLLGEDNGNPSYGVLGNYFAVGYIKGIDGGRRARNTKTERYETRRRLNHGKDRQG